MGRQENLEAKFMKSLKPVKLQYLNAESKLQIQLSKLKKTIRKTRPNTSASKLERSSENDSQVQNSQSPEVSSSREFLLDEFHSISPERKKFLSELLIKITSEWKFEEITSISDHDLFFTDGTQISYVLYEWLKMKKQALTSPQNEALNDFQRNLTEFLEMDPAEMLFLFLMCLIQRRDLCLDTTKEVLKRETQAIDFLKLSLRKVKESSAKQGNASSESKQLQSPLQVTESVFKLVDCLCWGYLYISKQQEDFEREFTDKSNPSKAKSKEK